MSDDQKPEGQQQADQAAAPVDWSSDYFPTSAKKVWLGWGMMLAGIMLLCFISYVTSEHPSDGEQVVKKDAPKSLARELDDSSEE